MSRGTLSLVDYPFKRESIGQGDIISGTDPAVFMTSNPLRLWVVQVGIIIIMSQLLSLGLRRLRQPKVIAELLGGILLGPTAFGRIPGFTEHIFPSVSLPYLSLVANIGLCFFFFLVGLEIDINSVKRNSRVAVIVSLAGIAIPFGLGSVLSVPLYHHFIDASIHFTYFMLFTGLAFSVTAFAVLCRVVTELRLLDTSVGIVVLSAGVCNEVLGWTLLSLNVALVNAGSGLSALWTLLVCIAFSVFLLFPVKSVLLWLARQTGSTDNGPTIFYMTTLMILLWACAFFADSIGVSAIFGALFAGFVIPREGGLAIALTEKLEDIVSIVFLPLYFALSGLNTDLGLLNNGITWAFTIAIIVVGFTGKFGASIIASRVSGYGWRESGTIGALMSCKGLMDLIVLNVALQAGILSKRVFSMFVLEAVVLTLTVTPLAMALYPPEHRVWIDESFPRAQGDSKHEHSDNDKVSSPSLAIKEEQSQQPWRRRLMVVLDKLDHVPSAMALTQLVLPPRGIPSYITSSTTITTESIDQNQSSSTVSMPHVDVEALRLVELSDRTSAAMMMMRSSSTMSASVAVADRSTHADPILAIFRTFGELNGVAVTTSLAVVPSDDFVESIAEHAQRRGSDMVLLPWMLGPMPIPISETASAVAQVDTSGGCEGDEMIEAGAGGIQLHLHLHPQSLAFVHAVFARCSEKTDVAMLVDTGDRVHDPRSGSGLGGGPVHVFLPFFGGADDRLALELVVQLCLNPRTTATVVRMINRQDSVVDVLADGRPSTGHHQPMEQTSPGHLRVASATSTVCVCTPSTNGRSTITSAAHLQSEMAADSITWAKYANASTTNPALRQALSRIRFLSDTDTRTPTTQTHTPTHASRSVQMVIQHARTLRGTAPAPRLLVVVGRSWRRPLAPRGTETSEMPHTFHYHYWWSDDGLEGMRRAIGDVGAAVVVGAGASASAVLVVQAGAVSGVATSASVVE